VTERVLCAVLGLSVGAAVTLLVLAGVSPQPDIRPEPRRWRTCQDSVHVVTVSGYCLPDQDLVRSERDGELHVIECRCRRDGGTP